MIIADRLKNTNRAEYLLYMWQVEDLIRAFQFNSERIAKITSANSNSRPNKERRQKNGTTTSAT